MEDNENENEMGRTECTHSKSNMMIANEEQVTNINHTSPFKQDTSHIR